VTYADPQAVKGDNDPKLSPDGTEVAFMRYNVGHPTILFWRCVNEPLHECSREVEDGDGKRELANPQKLKRLAKKKRWHAKDARYVLDAWQSSNESLADFSKQSGIGPWRVREWAKKLGPGQNESPAPRFLPVQIKQKESVPSLPWTVEAEYPSGAQLRINKDLGARELAAIATALGNQPC
jgi:hypothetical protein